MYGNYEAAESGADAAEDENAQPSSIQDGEVCRFWWLEKCVLFNQLKPFANIRSFSALSRHEHAQ